MNFSSTSAVRFEKRSIYREKQVSDMPNLLNSRVSFWIATFSLLAFVFGNLVGQHGWYAVYKSVLGSGLESQIVYDGTVAPIEKVPNYEVWAKYGGNSKVHTYRQIPAVALMDLPEYSLTLQNSDSAPSQYANTFSVGHAGSYATGYSGDGSHNGVDIAVPEGTPIRSIMNGIVHSVGEKTGYGITVVIKHPNVPSPTNPAELTTLYSTYAHLQSYSVTEGQIVRKGERIAFSGQTGNVTGPHLHFQIDLASAPFIPFWANDGKTSTVYTYSTDPMLYVQANYAGVTIVRSETNQNLEGRSVLGTRTTISRRTVRPDIRTVQRERVEARILSRSSSSASNTTVATNSTPSNIDHLEIRHDRTFTDATWEKIRIIAKDANGNVLQNPNVGRGIYLKTAFGSAEFDKPILQSADFTNGEAIVQMRSLEKRTVVIEVQPFGTLSTPLTYQTL